MSRKIAKYFIVLFDLPKTGKHFEIEEARAVLHDRMKKGGNIKVGHIFELKESFHNEVQIVANEVVDKPVANDLLENGREEVEQEEGQINPGVRLRGGNDPRRNAFNRRYEAAPAVIGFDDLAGQERDDDMPEVDEQGF